MQSPAARIASSDSAPPPVTAEIFTYPSIMITT